MTPFLNAGRKFCRLNLQHEHGVKRENVIDASKSADFSFAKWVSWGNYWGRSAALPNITTSLELQATTLCQFGPAGSMTRSLGRRDHEKANHIRSSIYPCRVACCIGNHSGFGFAFAPTFDRGQAAGAADQLCFPSQADWRRADGVHAGL